MRSYSCTVGQLRALYDLGFLEQFDVLSGVSGGAWASLSYAWSPEPDAGRRSLLGESLSADLLSLPLLDTLVEPGHLAWPVTQMATFEILRSSISQRSSSASVFGDLLRVGLLDPLGIDSGHMLLSDGPRHTQALIELNPGLDRGTILERSPSSPHVIASAGLFVPNATGGAYKHVHVSPDAATIVRAPADVLRVDPMLLVGVPLDDPREGLISAQVPDDGFSLSKLYASTGGAYGGVILALRHHALMNPSSWSSLRRVTEMLDTESLRRVRSASRGLPRHLFRGVSTSYDRLLVHAAPWFESEHIHDAFLVDGGYIDNTGVAGALLQGARRLIVFANVDRRFGNPMPNNHAGISGALSHLFGARPKFGAYTNTNMHLFPTEALDALLAGFEASKKRGVMPHAIVRTHLTPENPLGLPPEPVELLLWLNELTPTFVSALPEDTKLSLNMPGAGLFGAPHFPMAFANSNDPFRLTSRQVELMAHLHDVELRGQRETLTEFLEGRVTTT